MWLAIPRVPPFPNHIAVLHNDGANLRIGRNTCGAARTEFERATHEAFVVRA
jgi:hypothetical protein